MAEEETQYVRVRMPEVQLTQEEAERVLFDLFYGREAGEFAQVHDFTIVFRDKPFDAGVRALRAMMLVPGFVDAVTIAEIRNKYGARHGNISDVSREFSVPEGQNVVMLLNPLSSEQQAALGEIAKKMTAAGELPYPVSGVDPGKVSVIGSPEQELEKRNRWAKYFVKPLTAAYDRLVTASLSGGQLPNPIPGKRAFADAIRAELEKIGSTRVKMDSQSVADAADTLYTETLVHIRRIKNDGKTADELRPEFATRVEEIIKLELGRTKGREGESAFELFKALDALRGESGRGGSPGTPGSGGGIRR